MSQATGPIKPAVINESSAASNALVAAVASRKIRVRSLAFIAADAVTITFEDNGGTDRMGPLAFDAGGKGMVLPDNPEGWFETASGVGLNMLLSGAVQVGGCLKYQEVK